MFSILKPTLIKISNPRCLFGLSRNFSKYSSNFDVAINEKTGIATVTMQKAPVNTINKEFLNQIGNIVEDLEREKCKGMILTSSMKVFSSGLDFNEFLSTPENMESFIRSLFENGLKLYQTSLPTVSVINGHAPAGGCLFAIIAQYRIMMNNCKIGFNETRFGLILTKCFISMFENIIGKRESELALCLGKLYNTEEALRVGLVDEIVDDVSEGLERAEKFLLQFQQVDALAASMTKLESRRNVIEEFKRNAETETGVLVKRISEPQIQKMLRDYFKSVKGKNKIV